MAREFALINVTIWQDDDFRHLPALAKQLYFDMWTHPALSYCGVVDWRPGRFAAQHPDLSTSDIQALADCLEARLFIVTDSETEEALLRSWVRFDGLLKQPRLAVSYANAVGAVASDAIRGVLVYEAVKMHEANPEMIGWTKQQVANILTSASIDPRSRALPSDPFPLVFPQGFGQGLGETQGSVSLPPTTATATSTSLPAVPAEAKADDEDEIASRRKPETALAESWAPTAAHLKYATEKHVDLVEAVRTFRRHADTNDRRCRNWNGAFHTWLDKSPAAPALTPRTGSTIWDRTARSAS